MKNLLSILVLSLIFSFSPATASSSEKADISLNEESYLIRIASHGYLTVDRDEMKKVVMSDKPFDAFADLVKKKLNLIDSAEVLLTGSNSQEITNENFLQFIKDFHTGNHILHITDFIYFNARDKIAKVHREDVLMFAKRGNGLDEVKRRVARSIDLPENTPMDLVVNGKKLTTENFPTMDWENIKTGGVILRPQS